MYRLVNKPPAVRCTSLREEDQCIHNSDCLWKNGKKIMSHCGTRPGILTSPVNRERARELLSQGENVIKLNRIRRIHPTTKKPTNYYRRETLSPNYRFDETPVAPIKKTEYNLEPVYAKSLPIIQDWIENYDPNKISKFSQETKIDFVTYFLEQLNAPQDVQTSILQSMSDKDLAFIACIVVGDLYLNKFQNARSYVNAWSVKVQNWINDTVKRKVFDWLEKYDVSMDNPKCDSFDVSGRMLIINNILDKYLPEVLYNKYSPLLLKDAKTMCEGVAITKSLIDKDFQMALDIVDGLKFGDDFKKWLTEQIEPNVFSGLGPLPESRISSPTLREEFPTQELVPYEPSSEEETKQPEEPSSEEEEVETKRPVTRSRAKEVGPVAARTRSQETKRFPHRQQSIRAPKETYRDYIPADTYDAAKRRRINKWISDDTKSNGTKCRSPKENNKKMKRDALRVLARKYYGGHDLDEKENEFDQRIFKSPNQESEICESIRLFELMNDKDKLRGYVDNSSPNVKNWFDRENQKKKIF